MQRPLANRIIVSPVIEPMSDLLWTPEQKSRWSNGLLAVKGRVVAIGPEVDADQLKIGDLVHFSDSCGKEVLDKHIVIREDDVAFVIEDEDTKLEWVGATEVPCDVE